MNLPMKILAYLKLWILLRQLIDLPFSEEDGRVLLSIYILIFLKTEMSCLWKLFETFVFSQYVGQAINNRMQVDTIYTDFSNTCKG